MRFPPNSARSCCWWMSKSLHIRRRPKSFRCRSEQSCRGSAAGGACCANVSRNWRGAMGSRRTLAKRIKHMTRIDERACRTAQAKLDSYIDNELLTETNLELALHLEQCAGCAREVAARRALRDQLQTAVRQVPLPPALEDRVRARLREPRKSGRSSWLMAIAAAVVVCAAPWAALRYAHAAARTAALLRAGLDDHV